MIRNFKGYGGNIDLTPINKSINDLKNSFEQNQNLTWFTLNEISQISNVLMTSDVLNQLTDGTAIYTNNNSVNFGQEYRIPYCHALSENNDIYHKRLTESIEILNLGNPTTYTRGANLISLSDASLNSWLYTVDLFNTDSFYFYGMNDYNLLKKYDKGLFVAPSIDDSKLLGLSYEYVLHAPTTTAGLYYLNFDSVNSYDFYNRSNTWSVSFNSDYHGIQSFEYLQVKSMTASQNVNIYGLNCKTASFNPYAVYQLSTNTNTMYFLNLTQCSIDDLKLCNTRLYLKDCTIHTIANPITHYILSMTDSNQTINDLCATDGKLDMFKNIKDLTMNNATLSASTIHNSSGITYNNCSLNVDTPITHHMILNATNCTINTPQIVNDNTQLQMQEEFKNCSLNVNTYNINNGNIIGFDNCTLNSGITLSGNAPTIDFNNCKSLQALAGTVNYPSFYFNSINNTGLTITSDFSYTRGNVSLANCSNLTYIDPFNRMEYFLSNLENCKLQVGLIGNIETIDNVTMTLYDLDSFSLRGIEPEIFGNNSINFTYDSTATYGISFIDTEGAHLKINGGDETQTKKPNIQIRPNIQDLTISNCSVSFDTIGGWPTENKTLCLYDNYYTTNKSTISGLDYLEMNNETANYGFLTLNIENNNRILMSNSIAYTMNFFTCTHPSLRYCKADNIQFYNCNTVDIVDNRITNSQYIRNCSSIKLDLSPNVSHRPFLSFENCGTINFANTNITLESARFEYINSVITPINYIQTLTLRFGDEASKYCKNWDEVYVLDVPTD